MRSGILLPLAALATVVVAQLETLAKAKGFVYFGTATDNPELTDAPYVSLLSNISDFGQITPGNVRLPKKYWLRWLLIRFTESEMGYDRALAECFQLYQG